MGGRGFVVGVGGDFVVFDDVGVEWFGVGFEGGEGWWGGEWWVGFGYGGLD